jgi:hypothetical protein
MSGKIKNFSTFNTMLAGFERIFLSVMIGLVFPILLGLAGWWGSIPFVPEKSILYFALGGFILGILVNMVFIRYWMRNALRIPLLWPVFIYLFYSIGMLGFFMGIPVFNVIMGPVGGYYMGMRLRARNVQKDEVEREAKRTGLFTAFVLAIACAAALIIASLDSSLEANISGMFGLAKPISKTIILSLSAGAGIGLVFLEYAITRAAVKFASFLD